MENEIVWSDIGDWRSFGFKEAFSLPLPESMRMPPNASPRAGMRFVCAVPPVLGAVTKLSIRDGRVIAETESGIPMIVPLGG